MSASRPREALQEIKTITYSRVVSLSRDIHPGIPRWHNDPKIEFEFAASLNKDGYNLRRFSMGEHSGTHLNAPRSFYENASGVESIPAESLVAPATVIDVRDHVATNPDYGLALVDLEAWERSNGQVSEGSIVLLNTGWGRNWNSPSSYLGEDESGVCHFPGFGQEAAHYLLIERKVAGLGTDTPGVEPGIDEAFLVNKLALIAGRIVLENLAELDGLPHTGVTLVIGVLPLVGGTGSPASVLAFIP